MTTSVKRIQINYPSFQQFINFSDEKDGKLTDALISFFESVDSDVCPNIIETEFNILVFNTATKLISGSVNKIIDEYENKLGRIKSEIKVFIIDWIYPIDVIGELPQVTYVLPKLLMQNKFSIVICQNEILRTDIMPHIKDYINNNGILIVDKSHGINSDNVHGWTKIKLLESFHTYEPIISDRYNIEYNINDSDITLSDFVSFTGNKKDSLYDYLKEFIKYIIERKQVKLRLNSKINNILVLCEDDNSIRKNKYLSILQNCIGEIDFDSIETYHIGKNIAKQNLPYIARCNINNYYLINSTKFKIIISNICPILLITHNIDSIRNLLDKRGALIVNSCKREIEGFTKSDIDEFTIYIKEN